MKLRIFISAMLVFSTFSFAEEKPSAAENEEMQKQMAKMGEMLKLAETLNYQTGEITLQGGQVKIKLTDKFRFIDPKDSKIVLTQIWQNPPDSADGVLGMLIPTKGNILETWAIPIKASDDGHVKDDDYAKTDFNKMLQDLKKDSVESSKERERQGYGKMLLSGWAEPPHYDSATHKLYWAKTYDTGDPEDPTLNYDIRILGRKGTFNLSVVGAMSQLAEIKASTPEILQMVEFQPGHRYEDFDSKTDKIATYGVAGLIAGGLLTKAGFFKMLPLILLKAWKLVLVGAVFVGSIVKRMMGKKESSTYTVND